MFFLIFIKNFIIKYRTYTAVFCVSSKLIEDNQSEKQRHQHFNGKAGLPVFSLGRFFTLRNLRLCENLFLAPNKVCSTEQQKFNRINHNIVNCPNQRFQN